MIVITIEGGLVRGVSSDDPTELGKEVAVVNYDTDAADPSEVVKVPQGEGNDTEDATVDRTKIGVLFAPVASFLKKKA